MAGNGADNTNSSEMRPAVIQAKFTPTAGRMATIASSPAKAKSHLVAAAEKEDRSRALISGSVRRHRGPARPTAACSRRSVPAPAVGCRRLPAAPLPPLRWMSADFRLAKGAGRASRRRPSAPHRLPHVRSAGVSGVSGVLCVGAVFWVPEFTWHCDVRVRE